MFAFSQIDPRTNGQVTDMEVPLSRYLGAAAAEGQNDSMFNSVRQWRELSLESSDPAGKILQPEEANKTYGLPGLKWDRPVKENVASLMNTRHQAALDRAYFLSQDNHSLAAGVLGMGTQMASAMMNPLDLGAMFIPFVGEAKTANVLGRGALRTAIARGLISHEAFAEAIPRGTELARSVVQGGAYMGMAQTPIIANRMAEGGPGPGLQDLESIGMGSLFAAGMHLGIGGAARAFKFLDPGTKEAAFKKAVDDFAKGQDTDVSDIAKVGMEPEKPVAVAWKDESGVVHQGALGEIHPSLRERLHQEGTAGLGELGEDGFITNHGNFLNREEAAKLVGVDKPLDSIQMSGVDEVNFGTSTRLAKAGDVEGLTKYLIAHGAPGDAAAREYALAWIEKERTKDPTKLNTIQARENGFAKQEGKILSQPVIEEKQGHSPTPEDAEIAQVKEDVAELRRQLEEAAKESGMEVGESQIKEKVVSVAFKKGKKIYAGKPGELHSDLEEEHGIFDEKNSIAGFMTDSGRFVDREEAALLMSKKGVHELGGLDATQLSKETYEKVYGKQDPLAFVKQKGKLGKQGFYTIKDPRVSGFSMQVESDKITLVNLSVAEKGKGLGGEIIERVKKLADEQGKPVELIAYADNPFLQEKLNKFYETHGFKKIEAITEEGESQVYMYERLFNEEVAGEKIERAAYRHNITGEIYYGEPGQPHFMFYDTMPGVDPKDDFEELTNYTRGFLTNKKKFLTEEESQKFHNITNVGQMTEAKKFFEEHPPLEVEPPPGTPFTAEEGYIKATKLELKEDEFNPATDSIKAAADCLKKKIL